MANGEKMIRPGSYRFRPGPLTPLGGFTANGEKMIRPGSYRFRPDPVTPLGGWTALHIFKCAFLIAGQPLRPGSHQLTSCEKDSVERFSWIGFVAVTLVWSLLE